MLLSDLLVILMDTLHHDDIPVIKATNTINLFSWLTKALVMRGHKQASTWIDKFIGMLSFGSLGTWVAEGFKLIMAQDEEYLNSDNYSNIRSVLHICNCLYSSLLYLHIFMCSLNSMLKINPKWGSNMRFEVSSEGEVEGVNLCFDAM
jgi:hypothetical protein